MDRKHYRALAYAVRAYAYYAQQDGALPDEVTIKLCREALREIRPAYNSGRKRTQSELLLTASAITQEAARTLENNRVLANKF